MCWSKCNIECSVTCVLCTVLVHWVEWIVGNFGTV
jgi:hypothetical protein